MTPTIGRQVHYHGGVTPARKPSDPRHSGFLASPGEINWWTATVVYVDPAGKTVNLVAFDHDGCRHTFRDVAEGESPGQWRWPPRV